MAAMLMAELAAQCKAAGQTAHEQLDALYWQHGCHAEKTVSKTMPGSEGMTRMKQLMTRLRTEIPKSLAGIKVSAAHDYLNQVTIAPDGSKKKLDGPKDDLIIFDLESAGNYAAVRPSGTEPKVKFYTFAYEPAEQLANLDDTKAELNERLAAMERDLAAVADSV